MDIRSGASSTPSLLIAVVCGSPVLRHDRIDSPWIPGRGTVEAQTGSAMGEVPV